MKLRGLLCLGVIPFFALGADSSIIISPVDAKSVTYKITLYRDEQKYDQAAWDKVVADALSAITRASELQHDGNAANNEIVEAFVGAIEEIYRQNNAGAEGIHGQLSIDIADNLVN